MTIGVFLDGNKRDKIADFYDKDYACALLKGVLIDAENLEKDTQLVFSVRQGMKSYYTKEFLEKANKPIFTKEQEELINKEYEKMEKFYGEDL